MLDEFLIEIHATGQDHIPDGALVLVVTIGVDGDFLPEGKGRDGSLGVVAVGLPFLRAVDAIEADTFRALVVQDFDRVAVEDRDDGAGEVRASTTEKEEMMKPNVGTERISSLRLKWRVSISPLTPNNKAENTVQERHLCITRPRPALPVRKFIM